MTSPLMVCNGWRGEVDKLRREPHSVGLDRAPCGVVEADDTTLRANQDHGIKNN